MLETSALPASTTRLAFLDTNISILVSSRDGTAGVCVVEHRAPAGDSPPLHVHRNEDEIFVLLEGRLRLRLGEDDLTVAAGEAALAPRGIVHSYRVESPDGARFLTITRGNDFETLLTTVGVEAADASLPPRRPVTPEMAASLAAVCAANGIDLVGPPLA